MNDDEARAAYEDLQRRRDIVTGLLNRTREQLEALMESVKEGKTLDPGDNIRIQLLTFQGRVLLLVMSRLADEATQLTNNLAPTINPEEIEVPDYLPEEL